MIIYHLKLAGQGTIASEILSQLPENEVLDYIFITVGGGGLISGIASYLYYKSPSTTIVGVQPKASPVMYESIEKGEIIEMESLPTLSDGSAGGIESDTFTFSICQLLVKEWVLVEEDDIKYMIKQMVLEHNKIVEGAAACCLAGMFQFLKNHPEIKGKNSVAVVCGGNLDVSILKNIL